MKKEVLVLNKNYQAIRIISLYQCIQKLYLGKCYILDNCYNRYSFDQWVQYSMKNDLQLQKIYGVGFYIYLPNLIILKNYSRKKQPKLNKHNLYIRDGGCCQYCGKHFKRQKLTMDHVYPKSKGGKLNWQNVVLSCKGCNGRKGNKLLQQVDMKLIKKPQIPDIVELYINKRDNLEWLLPFMRRKQK